MEYIEHEDYIILSGNKEKSLAKNISDKLGIINGNVDIKSAQGTETSVNIKSYINYKKVFLIYDILEPINESIMNLLFLVDAIKKEGAERIYWVTSYLPYTKIKQKLENKLNFSLFARLLEITHIDKIFAFALYSPKISFYLRTPLYNISIPNIYSKVLSNNFSNNKNLLVSTIDYEKQEVCREIANKLNVKTLFPVQSETDKYKFKITENINNKDILIIADAINTAQTINAYTNYLAYKGAKNISILLPHGIVNKKAIPVIEKSVIRNIYIMNSHNTYKSNKIQTVSTSKIIEEIIRRTIEKKNIKYVLK